MAEKSAGKTMTGANILWECIEREGVTHVFGYPGGAILPAYDALKHSKIHNVLVRHEQGATHMADGYARASGKVGGCDDPAPGCSDDSAAVVDGGRGSADRPAGGGPAAKAGETASAKADASKTLFMMSSMTGGRRNQEAHPLYLRPPYQRTRSLGFAP